ncbi:MAG: NlpC-P60 family protein, partial [Pseudoxanthomonas sp.]
MRFVPPTLLAVFLLVANTCLFPAQARALPGNAAGPVPAHGVPGIDEAQLSAEFWVARAEQGERVVLDSAAIAAQNEKLRRIDASMNDLAALPAS